MTQTPSQSLDIGEAFRAWWRGFVANIGPLIVVAHADRQLDGSLQSAA